MFGAIVLRDIPKQQARIDLDRQQIQGGFRGFSMVPPATWHYVSVQANDHHVGFWCYLQAQEAVVKMYESDRFVDADADTQAQYASLALSGAMGAALIPYNHANFGHWFGLVRHIPQENFPPTLHAQDSGGASRFEQAFAGTHQGSASALLAEFQYAFVSWLVSLDTANEDQVAFARWRHLLLAAYNAGEDNIRQAGDLFPNLIDTLLRQFPLLPDNWFQPGSFLVQQAGYLAEDMIDTNIQTLADKGRAFADYLKKRQG